MAWIRGRGSFTKITLCASSMSCQYPCRNQNILQIMLSYNGLRQQKKVQADATTLKIPSCKKSSACKPQSQQKCPTLASLRKVSNCSVDVWLGALLQYLCWCADLIVAETDPAFGNPAHGRPSLARTTDTPRLDDWTKMVQYPTRTSSAPPTMQISR